MTADIQTKGNEIADGHTDAVFKSRQLPQTFTWYQIRDLTAAAVAEEASKRTCVGHGKTLCACYSCVADFKVEAAADERERIVKKIEDNANDGCLCCENTAAAIRKGVKP